MSLKQFVRRSVWGLLVVVLALTAAACAGNQAGGGAQATATPVPPTPTATATATPTPTPSPTPTAPPAPFQLTISSPQNGQFLSAGGPIACSGTYTAGSIPPPYVWVVLSDAGGLYYLQNPQVQFDPTTWTWQAPNVIPGHGITKIVVVSVTSAGNDEFQQKVANGDFGGFYPLPDNTTVLATVSVRVG